MTGHERQLKRLSDKKKALDKLYEKTPVFDPTRQVINREEFLKEKTEKQKLKSQLRIINKKELSKRKKVRNELVIVS